MRDRETVRQIVELTFQNLFPAYVVEEVDSVTDKVLEELEG